MSAAEGKRRLTHESRSREMRERRRRDRFERAVPACLRLKALPPQYPLRPVTQFDSIDQFDSDRFDRTTLGWLAGLAAVSGNGCCSVGKRARTTPPSPAHEALTSHTIASMLHTITGPRGPATRISTGRFHPRTGSLQLVPAWTSSDDVAYRSYHPHHHHLDRSPLDPQQRRSPPNQQP